MHQPKAIRKIHQFLSMLFLIAPVLMFSQSKKPNIVFILTDNHRWDALGVAGNTIIQTPEMDALANSVW